MAGGGIVEGALIGAAMGGGSAALQGKDPLKGALLGAATGGAGAGISGALAGGSAGAAGTAGAAEAGAASAAPIINGAVPGGSAAGVPYTPNMLSVANAGAGPMSTVPGMAQPIGAQVGAGPMSSAAATPVAETAGAGMQPPGGFIERFKGLPTSEKLLYGGGAGIGALMLADRNKYGVPKEEKYSGPLSKFRYDPGSFSPRAYADGGITGLNQQINVGGDPRRNPPPVDLNVPGNSDWQNSPQRMAAGGSTLGGYSDGGRLLKGPGDGMSDNIPAKIGRKQPARLAEGEFVVPADVVSHLGNGSTDAGAKQLYAMMNKVRHARTGNPRQGKQINPRRYMPA
jgi:hypothetical protein